MILLMFPVPAGRLSEIQGSHHFTVDAQSLDGAAKARLSGHQLRMSGTGG